MKLDFTPKTSLPKWIIDRFVDKLRFRGLAADGAELLPFGVSQPVPYGQLSETGSRVSRINLTVLKFFALLFLLPGLGGLIFSAMVSTDYLENLPRSPVVSEQRLTPRNVHGTVVYQTTQEDARLSWMEYTSVSVFLAGLVLGIVYLEKWSSARQVEDEADLFEELEA